MRTRSSSTRSSTSVSRKASSGSAKRASYTADVPRIHVGPFLSTCPLAGSMRLPPLRAWARRIWGLGPSRLALGLAILLALLGLALPVWSMAAFTGNTQDISAFSRTTIIPYGSNAFPTVAGVLGLSYAIDVAFLLLAAVVFAMFSLKVGRTMPTLGLLVTSLLVVGVGLLAIFYPILAIPGAATTDLVTFTVSGFWGSTNTGPTQVSWGAGLGWWLVLISVVSGSVGSALPYLKSIRAMVPPPPEDWQPPAR